LEGKRQEDLEFKARLGYIVKSCLKKTKSWGYNSVELLPSRCKALGLIPSTPENNFAES
jgi:hypothetical protein